jgi:hypothetical protein
MAARDACVSKAEGRWPYWIEKWPFMMGESPPLAAIVADGFHAPAASARANSSGSIGAVARPVTAGHLPVIGGHASNGSERPGQFNLP